MKKQNVMKYVSMLLLSICLAVTTIPQCVIAAPSTKLTNRETKIMNAYVKSLETGDISTISKYAHPDINYYETDYEGYRFKFISKKYTKEYDKSLKLYVLYVTGLSVVSKEDDMFLCKMKTGISIKVKNKILYSYVEVIPEDGSELVYSLSEITKTQLERLKKYLISEYGEEQAASLLEQYDKMMSVEEENND